MKRLRLIGRVVPRNFHGYRRMVMPLQTVHGLGLILMILPKSSQDFHEGRSIKKLYLKPEGRARRKMALGLDQSDYDHARRLPSYITRASLDRLLPSTGRCRREV